MKFTATIIVSVAALAYAMPTEQGEQEYTLKKSEIAWETEEATDGDVSTQACGFTAYHICATNWSMGAAECTMECMADNGGCQKYLCENGKKMICGYYKQSCTLI